MTIKPETDTTHDEGGMTFWEHLDVLRGTLIKMGVAVVACGLAAFVFKDEIFAVILAPKK